MNEENKAAKVKKPFFKKWWFWVIIIVIGIGVFGQSGDETKKAEKPAGEKVEAEKTTEKKEEPKEKVKEDKALTLGDSFDFDGFNVKLSSDYSFAKIENQFSEHDGKDAIVLPVTITNNSGETKSFNMFYFSTFDQTGNKTDGVSSYFDNSIDFSGEMRDGAVKDTNFHILYSEDGDYYIEFKKPGGEKIEVKLPIVKK